MGDVFDILVMVGLDSFAGSLILVDNLLNMGGECFARRVMLVDILLMKGGYSLNMMGDVH